MKTFRKIILCVLVVFTMSACESKEDKNFRLYNEAYDLYHASDYVKAKEVLESVDISIIDTSELMSKIDLELSKINN